jgi:hypothetical protein
MLRHSSSSGGSGVENGGRTRGAATALRSGGRRVSVGICILPPLHVQGLGDFPQSDPHREHRLTGSQVVLVKRGTLPVPLGQELVLARLRSRAFGQGHR